EERHGSEVQRVRRQRRGSLRESVNQSGRAALPRYPNFLENRMKRKNRRKPRKLRKVPAWVARAERAFRRAARNVRAECRAHGVGVIVWENGKVVEKRV